MKKVKRISVLITLAIIATVFIPSTALAAVDYQITSISLSPSAVAPTGGSVNVTITLKNTGTDPITSFDYTYQLPSGPITKSHLDTISPGASKSYTDNITFASNDLDVSIQTVVWCWGGSWVNHNKNILVKSEDNIIRSGSSIEPEKNIYYVGDTVAVTDTMRNSLSVNVSDLEMQYYYRHNGATNYKDTVTFGTVTPNQKVENTLDYTFTENDIGELRIGSKVTYKISGTGPYTEYNVAHDFTVEASPTPTPSPEPTASPTPEATVEPTLEPTAQPTQAPVEDATQTPLDGKEDDNKDSLSNEEVKNNDEKDSGDSDLTSVLGDRTIVMTIIIAAGVIIVFLMVLIIIVATKKR